MPEAMQPPAGCIPATDERIRIGASWYPEMWPETEWPGDVQRMQELGYNMVRLFEFAWHRFEPQEGAYDFDWARQILDLCHHAGIAVMIGTPTAAPPAWLTDTYPEVLGTHADGRRQTHGQRKHYNPHSRRYRELAAGIVDRICRELAGHPAVHSWQIDNEMSGYDYGPETKTRFHQWLEARYGTIAALNRTWGLEFWSQAYSSFSQVPLCAAQVGSIEIPERHHPSLIMAIARFQNEGWSTFIAEQCAVIRRYSSKPITTNMVASGGMDWFRHNRALDVVGHSMYKDVPHYPWCWMLFDRMRAEKPRPYWLLETAPNWSGGGRVWNIHEDRHGLRLMSWMSMLMGGSMILYWQWRQHWAGQEVLHGTLVTATGRWRPNHEVHRKLAAEFSEHSQWLLSHPPAPAQTAILLSNQAAWAFSIDPYDASIRYMDRWRDDFYQPLVREHIWRDVIGEDADLSPYRVLILPLMPMIPAALRARLETWVRNGGKLLLGPLTGIRTEEFTVWQDREFGGLEDLMGVESAAQFPVLNVEETVCVRFLDGETSRLRVWADGFHCTTARPLAYYEGGYGDGTAAVTEHQVGQGCVISCGAMLEPAVFVKVTRRLLQQAQIECRVTGSPDVLAVPRADRNGNICAYAVMNMTREPNAITLPFAGKDRLSGTEVNPTVELSALQVAIIEQ